jgi:glutamate formiminotransferase
VLECVLNVSEGRDRALIDTLGAAAGAALLDIHTDPHHHRSVLTMVGEDAPRAVARLAVERIDLADHEGVHPRIGVVDVVPFSPLGSSTMDDAGAARDRFALWAAAELALPCFLYGPERSLPEVRRRAFEDLMPDTGPALPHPSAGAAAVGARPVLVAYNLWLEVPDLARATSVAATVRGPAVRALGLAVGERVQVSLNLIEPDTVGPAEAFDLVAAHVGVAGAELVGLLPQRVLDAVPVERWDQLDVGADRTIESRLRRVGGSAS